MCGPGELPSRPGSGCDARGKHPPRPAADLRTPSGKTSSKPTLALFSNPQSWKTPNGGSNVGHSGPYEGVSEPQHRLDSGHEALRRDRPSLPPRQDEQGCAGLSGGSGSPSISMCAHIGQRPHPGRLGCTGRAGESCGAGSLLVLHRSPSPHLAAMPASPSLFPSTCSRALFAHGALLGGAMGPAGWGPHRNLHTTLAAGTE